ncbi:hypothetical protein ACVW1A_003959 [Bradyrhizobium sp. LB1.3]
MTNTQNPKKKSATTRKPKPRKKSLRTKGSPRATRATSERLKELWATPEFRERMKQRDKDRIKGAKSNSAAFSRLGIPDGMKRSEALRLWTQADELADKFIVALKKTGEIPDDSDAATVLYKGFRVPATDDGLAEGALRQAFVLAVGPTSPQVKAKALNIVLTYTRAKPAHKAKLLLGEVTEFLDAISNDNHEN